MLNWFNALVVYVVLVILAAACVNGVAAGDFNALTVAAAVFPLLMLPILYRFATRRAKERPVHMRFPQKKH